MTKILMSALLIVVGTVGCTDNATTQVEQANCTSPPAPPGVHQGAQCMPAYNTQDEAAYDAYVAALSVGVTLDVNSIAVDCQYGFCDVEVNFDPSGEHWIHITCSNWNGLCTGGVCSNVNGQEVCH
jgi:hypothetical protein